MTKTSVLAWLAAFVITITAIYLTVISSNHKTTTSCVGLKAEEGAGKSGMRFMMLRDPATNQVPYGIHRLERNFAEALNRKNKASLNKNGLSESVASLTWTAQGPFNIAGRICAIKMDVTDTNILVAGSSTGGIFRSTDRGGSWTQCLGFQQLGNVYCLVQDTRVNKRHIWYAGTGEVSSAGSCGKESIYRGDGIYKSTDGGLSWNLLASTVSGTPQTYSRFDYVYNIVTDASNSSQDIVYAATSRGIERSSDGGTTWTWVLIGDATKMHDVAISPVDGTVYAVLGQRGVFRSVNGTDWINISEGTGMGIIFSRGVIAICPSNPNVVYVFLGNSNNSPTRNGHEFWKYAYLSGNGQGSGGQWENRTEGLMPDSHYSGYTFGDFCHLSSQSAVFMKVMVKPDDENFVILCTNSLHRSTDGFQDTANVEHLGGYDPESLFHPVLHCDIMDGCFNPQNPNIFYSANDGGVTRTEDITTNYSLMRPVDWISCSSGLGNTQPYGASLSPDNGSSMMIAGFQDQGARWANSNEGINWSYLAMGDGTSAKIGPEQQNRFYYAMTNTSMFRTTRSGTQQMNMGPSGALNTLWSNPHAFDPYMPWYLYFGGGYGSNATGIWRNLDAPNATVTNGWVYLDRTGFDDQSQRVSAIGVSKNWTPYTVYYGTNMGKVRRIDYANSDYYEVTDITTGLPADGYVSSISVDPDTSNKVLVTFSNYNFQSLWYSTNGGANWNNVEGNLAGATGPSVNSSLIFYVSGMQHVFVGTSVGLFFNPNINSVNKGISNWEQIGVDTRFGNMPVSSIDFRSVDNTMLISTMGAGMFQTQFNEPLPVELSDFSAAYANGKVWLKWQTKSEINNSGFVLERNYSGFWENIANIKGYGNSNIIRAYAFTDDLQRLKSIKVVKYRLRQIDNEGTLSYSKIIEVSTADIPKSFTVSQNYPNPFNPVTTIQYALPRDEYVELKVFTSNGQLVRTEISGRQPAGYHTLEFNCNGLASGVYIYCLQAGSLRQAKKMIIVK